MSEMENLESSLNDLWEELELWHDIRDYNAGQLGLLARRKSGFEPVESMVMFRLDPEVLETNGYGTIAVGEEKIYEMVLNDLAETLAPGQSKLTLYNDGQDEIFICEWHGQEVHLLISEWYTPPGSKNSSKLLMHTMAFGILPGPALTALDEVESQRASKLGVPLHAIPSMNKAQLWVYEHLSGPTREPEFFSQLP